MELIYKLSHVILHFDYYLRALICNYGLWTYCILFIIIFCETGLVFTPILPGDALLITAGTLIATTHHISINLLSLLLIFSAILGNYLNYSLGKIFGHRFNLNPLYLKKTQEFYQKYGAKTIVIARFIPIVRTFAPFLAGIANMEQLLFLRYTIFGSCIWIGGLLYASYYLGNTLWLQQNLKIVIILVILFSVLPNIYHYWREKKQ